MYTPVNWIDTYGEVLSVFSRCFIDNIRLTHSDYPNPLVFDFVELEGQLTLGVLEEDRDFVTLWF